MLRIENLVINIGDKKILKDTTYTFKPGKVTFIQVPQGEGSSTMFRAIAGLEQPTMGTVIIDHRDTRKLREHALANIRARKMGLIFETPKQVNELSVHRNIEIPLRLIGVQKNKREARINELANEFGIAHFLQKESGLLRPADRQMASICRALANDPDIILADEPTLLLNRDEAVHAFRVLRDIAKMTNKIVVIFSSKNVPTEFVDEVIEVKNQKFVLNDDGTGAAIDIVDSDPILNSKFKMKDRLSFALESLFRRKLQNIVLLFLSSIGIALSLLATFASSAIQESFSGALSQSLDTNQLDVVKTSLSGNRVRFNNADHEEMVRIGAASYASGTYENYHYNLSSVSYLGAFNDDQMISALKREMYNGENINISQVQSEAANKVIATSLNGGISTLPATKNEIDLLPPEATTTIEDLTREMTTTSLLVERMRNNLFYGNVPTDVAPINQPYSAEILGGNFRQQFIPQVVITTDFARTLVSSSGTLITSMESIVGQWFAFDYTYETPIQTFKADKQLDIPKENLTVNTNFSSSYFKVVGIINKEIYPGSVMYLPKLFSTNIISSIAEIAKTTVNILPGFDEASNYIAGSWNYSIVSNDSSHLGTLADEITRNPRLSLSKRAHIINIIKSSEVNGTVLILSSFVIAFISMLVVATSIMLFLYEAEKETGMLKAIGISRLNLFANSYLESFIILVLINIVGNILCFGGMYLWNMFNPENLLSYDVSSMLVTLSITWISLFILIFLPTYRNASIDVAKALRDD